MKHFAASVDGPDDLRRFAESLSVDYPLLSDASRRVARAYGVVKDDTTPALRWTFYIGLDGKILYIDKAVSPGTHGQAVANKLAELGVPRRQGR